MKLAALLVILVSHAALADDRVAVVDPDDADEPAAPRPPDPVDPIEVRRQLAGSSRGLGVGTALTTPAMHGEIAFRAVEHGVLSTFAAGITPTTELWVDGGTLDSDDALDTLGYGVKQVLGRGARWQVAATAAVRRLYLEGSSGDVRVDTITLLSLGTVVSVCSASCTVMASGSLGGLLAAGGAVPSASLALSVGGRVVRGQLEGITYGDLAVGFLGVHVAGTQIGLDLGALVVGGDRTVLPFGGFTARL